MAALAVSIAGGDASRPTIAPSSHVLSRTGFGPRPGDVERVRALGLQRYIDEQLHPERIADAADDRTARGLDDASA